MKNLQIRKTMTMLAMVSLTLVTINEMAPLPVYNTGYSINQSYNRESNIPLPYATCESGDVYIGKEKDLKRLDEKVRRNSVLIIDERTCDDPNMKIMKSYAITSKSEMASIAGIMQEYNEEYPSNWNRSTDSIINEWEIHNICSDFSFMPSHTDDVDLNNGDEIIYKSKFLSKVLR